MSRLPKPANSEAESVLGLKLPRTQLAEWIFRLVLLVGLLYLSNNYVSIKDYRLDEARKAVQEAEKTKLLGDINLTLARIDERSKNDDSKARIAKMEEALQALEKVKASPPLK